MMKPVFWDYNNGPRPIERQQARFRYEAVMGCIAMQAGKWPLAVHSFKTALSLYPNNDDARKFLDLAKQRKLPTGGHDELDKQIISCKLVPSMVVTIRREVWSYIPLSKQQPKTAPICKA